MGFLTFPLRLLGQAVSMNAADLSTATKPWEVQLDQSFIFAKYQRRGISQFQIPKTFQADI